MNKFFVALILMVLGLSACAPSNKIQSEVFSTEGQTAYQVFVDSENESQVDNSSNVKAQPLRYVSDNELSSYWRGVRDNDKHNARYHVNPTLYMSVFPNMTNGGTAQPGYDTTFKMYRTAPVKFIGE